MDSTRYSALSMLRTMETILDVQPLSQFDATAPLMAAAFTAGPPDARPYDAIVPRQALDELNPGDIRFGPTLALGALLGAALALAGAVLWQRRGRVR